MESSRNHHERENSQVASIPQRNPTILPYYLENKELFDALNNQRDSHSTLITLCVPLVNHKSLLYMHM